MKVRPVSPVAWKNSAQWSAYHLCYDDEMNRTLCNQPVPAGCKVQRYRTSDDETCKACVAKLDQITAKRLSIR